MSPRKCVEYITLTCPSANTYLILVKPECAEAIEASLRARGEVLLDTSVVLGVRLGWARITFIKPSRLHVTIPREKNIEEVLRLIFGETPAST